MNSSQNQYVVGKKQKNNNTLCSWVCDIQQPGSRRVWQEVGGSDLGMGVKPQKETDSFWVRSQLLWAQDPGHQDRLFTVLLLAGVAVGEGVRHGGGRGGGGPGRAGCPPPGME